MNRIVAISLSLVCLCAAALAQSNQNVAKGFQADKTYEVGQLDAINLFNGNLTVGIPIGQNYTVSPTLSYEFRLVYTGNNWKMDNRPDEWTQTYFPNDPNHEPVTYPVTRYRWELMDSPGGGANAIWQMDNAGFGWRLSLGRLEPESSIAPFTFAGGTYRSPDGGSHRFWPKFHEAEKPLPADQDPKTSYTNDGTYLRLRIIGDGTCNPPQTPCAAYEIDFPDGNIHAFDRTGTLIEMRDRFGNKVTLSTTQHDGVTTWTVSDSTSNPPRVHEFEFHSVGAVGFPILKSAKLAAFGGGIAEYTFHYVDGDEAAHVDKAVAISRPFPGVSPDCSKTIRNQPATNGPNITPVVLVPLLETIVLPTSETYKFQYDRGDKGATFSDPELAATAGETTFVDPNLKEIDGQPCTCKTTPGFSGTLTTLTLPTGGSLDWKYRLWFYSPETGRGGKVVQCTASQPVGHELEPCFAENGLSQSVGVAVREEHDWDERILSRRAYDGLGDSTPVDWNTLTTTVTSYSADGTEALKTLNFYSAKGKDTTEAGRTEGHYGLPYTREKDSSPTTVDNPGPADAPHKGYLSTKTYDGENLLAYSYVMYEGDDSTFEAGDSSNRRVQTQINVDVIEGTTTTTWTSAHHSDFDGVGHYRTTEESGSVADDPVRRTTTSYHPNLATWVLNTYDSSRTEELHDNIVTSSRASSSCFDATTGFLNRVRTIRGPAEGPTDFLTVFTPETRATDHSWTGQIAKESYFGGDAPLAGGRNTQLSVGFLTCSDPPGTPAFEVSHEYQYGVRNATQHSGSAFKSFNLSIDRQTGLVSASTDPLNRVSTYDYDAAGRILNLKPAGQAWTRYEYNVSARQAVARQYAAADTNAVTPLTESRYYYDGLGRLEQQKSQMPEGWTTSGQNYNWLGQKKSSYVAKAFTDTGARSSSDSAAVTTFVYDSLGRPTTTTAPDQSTVVLSYPTSRQVTRTVKIATVKQPAGEDVTTTETYDVFKRLARVDEPAGTIDATTPSTTTTTRYEYDAGGNLLLVNSGDSLLPPPSAPEPKEQKRTFVYDGAGLLVEEKHPEVPRTTYDYDARGHVTRKCVGGTGLIHCAAPSLALQYAYDSDERPTTVTDGLTGNVLKSLHYDDTELGRLATQTRYNYFADSTTYAVKDTFTYEPATGRPLDKKTEITSPSTNPSQPPVTFTQKYDYNKLGAPDNVLYPTCSSCGSVADNERKLALQYQYGFLTGIQGITAPLASGAPLNTAITYTPLGAVERVQHATAAGNPGVEDVFARDPNGMARLASIQFKNAADCILIQAEPADKQVPRGSDITVTIGVATGATAEWFEGAPGDVSKPAGTGTSLVVKAVVEERTFWCRVRMAAGGCEDRSRMVVVDIIRPDICTEPPTLTVVPAQIAEGTPFRLQAPAVPLATYRWYSGGSAPHVLLADTGTTAYYDVTSGIAAVTSYYAEVRTTKCTAMSNELVISPCLYKREPSATKIDATRYLLSVGNDQADVKYQWYEGHDYLDVTKPRGTEFAVYVQPTTPTYYWVRMTSLCGTLDSTFILVKQECEPKIFVQPAPASGVLSGTASNTVSAKVIAGGAGPFTYQWFEVPNDGTAERILCNETGDTYTLVRTGSAVSKNVFVKVKLGTSTPDCKHYDDGRTAASSAVVTLAYAAAPQHIAASSGSVTLNDPHLRANLYVTMDPPQSAQPNPEHDYAYEWYMDDGTAAGFKIGYTTSSMSVPAAGAAAYWVVVSGTHRKGMPDEYHEVTVSPKMFVHLSMECALPPLRVEQSVDRICNSADPNAAPNVTFRAFNAADDVTYQWYTGQSGDTRTPISSNPGKPDELTVSSSTVWKVWVRATRDCNVRAGSPAHLDSPTLSFSRGACAPLFIDQNVASVDVPWGGDAQLVVDPNGGPHLVYQWYRKAEAGEPSDVAMAGGSSSTFDLHDVRKSRYYWLTVRDSQCSNSEASTLPTLVRVASAPGMPPPNWVTEVWRDSDSTSDTVLNALTTGARHYVWFQGQVPDETHPVSDSTQAAYTTPRVTADTSYWVRVYGDDGKFLDSPTIMVKVCNPPKLTPQQQAMLVLNHEIIAGQYTALYVPITEPVSGSRFLYEWYRGEIDDVSAPQGVNNVQLDLRPAATTRYWFRASTTCGINGSNPRVYKSPQFIVTVCTTPAINGALSVLPSRIVAGSSSTLTVSATVSPDGPLTYQWYIGTPGDPSTPVTNGAARTINVSPTADTTYWVRVTRGACSIDSGAVTVSICTYPQSVTLPATVNLGYGDTTTLRFPSMNPLNEAKFIRWYKGAVGDTSTLVRSAASAASLDYTTPPMTATASYWVEFDHLGCTTRSTATTVKVCWPAISTQPAGTTISNGATATLTVATTAIAGQTFQWYKGSPGDTTNAVALGTNSSVGVSPSTTTSYWVRVTGPCSPAAVVDSAAATVTVCNAPVVTASPTLYIRSGQQGGVSVTASGANLTYQWYLGVSGTTTNPIAGATSSSSYYPSPMPSSTTNYWCRVTSQGTCATNSPTATIDVCTLPVVDPPTASASRIFSGGSSTLTVNATSNGTMTYQWYAGVPGDTASPVANGTSRTVTVSPAVDTTYWVRVTSRVCSTDSAAVAVSLCTYPSTVTLPATVDIASGETATLQFPQLAPLSELKAIRWYKGAAGDTSTLVRGAASASTLNYTTPALTANTQYWLEFDHNTCTTRSTTTTVRVCKPAITSSPQSVVIPSGGTQTLTVATTGSPLTYQWYIGNSGVTSQPVNLATSSSLTISPSATTTYWVRVTGCASTADSAAATVTVCAAPAVTNLTKTSNSAIGSSGTLTVTATGTNLAYQWYKGQSGDTSRIIAGATSSSYTFTLQSSEYYWVRVTSSCNASAANSAALLYSVAPNITTQPANVTISRGTSTKLTVAATGTYLSYQWVSQSASTGIPGATSATYTTPALSSNADYYCEVKSGAVSVNSLHALVTVCDGPTISSFATTYNSGTTYRLTVTVPSSQASLVRYFWYSGVAGDPSQSISLGENTPQQYFTVTSPTTYWVRVWFSDNSCYTDTAGKTLP
jgi:YD repeat-containing protein